ncbi:MAG: hypothetical protein R3B53_00040 [Candidatus Paceibacterota bacterium]
MKAKGSLVSRDQYPGGAMVTVGFIGSGQQLLLRRDTRHTYSLPMIAFDQDQSLIQMPSELARQLGSFGIDVNFEPASVELIGAVGIAGTLHILMLVSVVSVRSPSKHEYVNRALILSGLSVSNPLDRYLPGVLGWRDADYYNDRLAA